MSLQKKIIKTLGVQSIINTKKEIRKSIDFLKKYLICHKKIKSLILGISGGQDSTLAGKLCQLAISELRSLTGNNDYTFIALRLPYGDQIDEKDCQDALSFIQPDRCIKVNIKNAVLASQQSLRDSGVFLSDFLRGNEKARERMKVQYSIAGLNNGIVIGTDHAAEAVTGFFTKYGDAATDINPLFRLNKRQIRQILQTMCCPQHLYLKKPTADLEDNYPSKEDEEVLGISYDLIDDYLEGKNLNIEHTSIIEMLYLKTQHKRHLPITVFDNFWK
ncbi:NAD(+) synthase [Candidatus Pantoea edessiphila]|uniref:NH(3)-dependent NAD(+) synthetase n=1 Tax=Candidatus Pantoea edessiphila TaxID=2044610 RepID=A0A2P5SYT9_9GAMM|nr:ammonia-dependent NAD(+) synthetase [Candidatus Pantoea edessiphila]MBK4775374.1 ammonia-dependent NAD(+) synthetase [Pantoea sp. Edef]PPI87495.1 NAD(+) synthase [Candidatus Pantoea edessiphila]